MAGHIYDLPLVGHRSYFPPHLIFHLIPVILWTVLGGQAFHWLGRQPAEVWALILLAFVALAFLWHRLLSRRGAKS